MAPGDDDDEPARSHQRSLHRCLPQDRGQHPAERRRPTAPLPGGTPTQSGLDTAWRVAVFALGVTLMVAGVIMFVIPGPGWATLILGLVVLASEFRWANRALTPVKDAAKRASDAAMDPRKRRRNLTLAAIAGVLMGVVLVWYLLTYGLTLGPIMDLAQGLLDWFKGLFT